MRCISCYLIYGYLTSILQYSLMAMPSSVVSAIFVNSFIQVHLLLFSNLQSSCPYNHFSSFLTSPIFVETGNRESNLDKYYFNKCLKVAKSTRESFPALIDTHKQLISKSFYNPLPAFKFSLQFQLATRHSCNSLCITMMK